MSPFLPQPVRKLIPSLALIALLGFACSLASQVQASPGQCPSGHDCLSSGQQRCMNAISKGYRKLSSAYGREISKCIKKISSPLSSVSLEECLSNVDTRPKVISAQARLLDADSQLCAVPPPIGFTSGAVASQAAINQELGLLVSVFGPDLGAAIPSAQLECQRKVFRQIQRCRDTGLKFFNRCKKKALARVFNFDDAAENLGRSCLHRNVLTEIRLTGKPKALKRHCRGGIFRQLLNECPSFDDPEVLSPLFPGECSGPTDRGFTFCILERMRCQMCLGLTTANDLPNDCDLFDDFNPEADGSCP